MLEVRGPRKDEEVSGTDCLGEHHTLGESEPKSAIHLQELSFPFTDRELRQVTYLRQSQGKCPPSPVYLCTVSAMGHSLKSVLVAERLCPSSITGLEL